MDKVVQHGCLDLIKQWLLSKSAPTKLGYLIINATVFWHWEDFLGHMLLGRATPDCFLRVLCKLDPGLMRLKPASSKKRMFDWLLFWTQFGQEVSPPPGDLSDWLCTRGDCRTNTLVLDACSKAGLVGGTLDLERIAPAPDDIDLFPVNSDVPLLDWILAKFNGQALFPASYFLTAMYARSYVVLEWWKRAGFPVRCSRAEIMSVLYEEYQPLDEVLVEWWERSGLVPAVDDDSMEE